MTRFPSTHLVRRLTAGAAIVAALAAAAPAFGQVPARFYWKTLTGSNAVPLIYMTLNGNTNPFDDAHTVVPGAHFDATMALVGYAHTFVLFDRAATAAFLVPTGRVSSEITVGTITSIEQASGFGDPTAELAVNIIGKKPIRNIPDLIRFEPGLEVDALVDLAIPIGEYSADQALNLGQNRWYGRFATPIVWQLGAWVPGRRTTLEVLPSLWLFGPNNDYQGKELTTDPMFQLEGHVTRDLTKDLWASLDVTWATGGQASIDGVTGSSLNNLGVGYTLGYQVNDNIQATFGYMSTVNDNSTGDLQLDGFRLSVVFGWNPLIEGMKRIKGKE